MKINSKTIFYISIIISLLIFFIVIITILIIGNRNNTKNESAIAISHLATNTITPVATLKATDPYKDWKSYYYEPWDITIKYPSDYEIVGNYDPNDKNAYQECQYLSKEFFKDYSSCKDKVYFPAITLHKLGNESNENYINLFGPAAVGGECAPGSTEVTYNVTIMGKLYTYNLKREPDGKYCSRDSRIYNVTAIGPKSIWSKYSISVSADNEEIFNELLRILSTIS